MTLWLDGLTALRDHGEATLWVMFVIIWGVLIVAGMLDRFFQVEITKIEVLSLAVSGWIVPVMLWGIISFGIALWIGETAAKIFSTLIFAGSLFFIKIRRIHFSVVLLSLFLLISIIVRFAFLRDLLLPAYFDSAEHYRLIQALSVSMQQGVLPLHLTNGIYHLGFHILGAVITCTFSLNVVDFMLVIGPLILATLPIPIFGIIYRETDSIPASLFACLIAAIGFHMPAHLLNWGKYPALLSLVCMQFVFGIAYIAGKRNLLKTRKFIPLLLIGILISVVAHSRTLIVYGLVVVAVFLAYIWKQNRTQYWFGILIITLTTEMFLIQSDPMLKLLLEGYLHQDVWMMAVTFALAIASIRFFQTQIFFLLAIISLFLLALFVPITFSVYGTLTLLDRPYVQILLYLPLSTLGGLGFASLQKWIQRLFSTSNLFQYLLFFLLFGIILFNAFLHYNFYPSPCCNFVTRDDLASFSWIQRDLPTNAKMLIASSGLYVTSFESPNPRTGVDSGIWVEPLTSRKSVLAWQGIRFDIEETHRKLCADGISYIYVGGMPQSFDDQFLANMSNWYIETFALPKAKIYQVIDCP